jgi:hypothetical protein
MVARRYPDEIAEIQKQLLGAGSIGFVNDQQICNLKDTCLES